MKKYFILTFIFTLLVSQTAQAAVSYDQIVTYQNGGRVLGAATPELPRVYLTTSVASTPITGQTITVPAGGDLQAALNSANLGDQIVLTAGATYSGNFVLPNKTSGSGWITIRTSNMAGIPVENNRISPAYASAMPKIITPNVAPAIITAAYAHHYRFIGVEVGTSSVNIYNNLNYVLVDLGAVDPSDPNGRYYADAAKLPHDIIIDRSYIHGNIDNHQKRGVAINGYNESVIDSYISDIHGYGQDTQAIAGYAGPGPFKIVNNYLEAAGENFVMGGAEPPIANLNPSDIEFRNNYLFKPLSWMEGSPSYAGRHWLVKNLFELKSGQRVLVDGNIMENNWVDGQVGFAVLFQGLPSDTGLWAVVKDVTFTHNIIKNSVSGFNSCGGCMYSPVQTTNPNAPYYADPTISRVDTVDFSNNLFENLSGTLLQPLTNSARINFSHNTGINAGNTNLLDGPKSIDLTEQNNIMGHGLYGVFGNSVGEGTIALSTYTNGYTFSKNVLANSPAGIGNNYPAGNYFPVDWASVGFVNFSAGDYRLASNSPYKNAGTDGKDIGADISAINTATANVVSGNFGGSPSPSPSPTPTPTPTPTPVPASAVYAQPTSVTFSSQAVGASSASQMITLHNTSSVAITVSSLTVSGDYTIATNYCNNGLVPNSHCDVYITFTPTTSGTRTGTLTFVETNVASSPQIVTLTGTGTGAASPTPTPTPSPTPTPTPSPNPSSTPNPTPSPSPASGGGSYTPPAPISGGANQTIAKLRLVNDSGTFYLIENNQKHGITNPGMLASYGFNFSDAKLATAQDQSLTQGSLLTPGDGSLVKSAEDPTVYLISSQKRYGFVSAKVFTDLGFKFSSVLTVTNPELQALPKAADLDNGAALHLPGTDINKDGTVYWLGYDNQLHGYPSLDIYNSWHLKNDFSAVVPANSADMSLPMGGFVGTRVVE